MALSNRAFFMRMILPRGEFRVRSGAADFPVVGNVSIVSQNYHKVVTKFFVNIYLMVSYIVLVCFLPKHPVNPQHLLPKPILPRAEGRSP